MAQQEWVILFLCLWYLWGLREWLTEGDGGNESFQTVKLWILQPNEWLLFQIYDLLTAWLWWVMTYLHTIKEFIMTIYHQSNITRVEEVHNNARRAANIVLAVNLPKYHRAKVGLAKEGIYFWAHAHREKYYGRACGWVGESPERFAYKGNISRGRRDREYIYI